MVSAQTDIDFCFLERFRASEWKRWLRLVKHRTWNRGCGSRGFRVENRLRLGRVSVRKCGQKPFLRLGKPRRPVFRKTPGFRGFRVDHTLRLLAFLFETFIGGSNGRPGTTLWRKTLSCCGKPFYGVRGRNHKKNVGGILQGISKANSWHILFLFESQRATSYTA